MTTSTRLPLLDPQRATKPARRVGSVLGIITPAGWVLLGVGIVLLGLGRYFGWLELYVPGIMALAIFLTALGFVVGRSAYRVDLDLADHRVKVGEAANGAVVVTNVSKRRLLPAYITLPVGKSKNDFPLPSLAGGEQHEEIFSIPALRRAVVQVGPVYSVRGDALGVARRSLRWTDAEQVFIHPEIVSLAGASSGVLRDLEGQSTRVLSDADMSFHALRDYEPGDDKRHIHWRSTARLGRLVVKQFEDTRRTHTAIVLSTNLGDYATADEAEIAISAAASLGVQATIDRRNFSVLAGTGHLRAGGGQSLLDDFSGLEVSSSQLGGLDLAKWVAKEVPDASVVFLIFGSQVDSAAVRASTAHIPAGVRVVSIQVSQGAPLKLDRTGMLSSATLGALTDLGRLVRYAVNAQ